MAFTKRVTYDFEVNHVGLTVSPIEEHPSRELQCVKIEETRKNGQEDCHMMVSGMGARNWSGVVPSGIHFNSQ